MCRSYMGFFFFFFWKNGITIGVAYNIFYFIYMGGWLGMYKVTTLFELTAHNVCTQVLIVSASDFFIL
jgi:hypothetical protein